MQAAKIKRAQNCPLAANFASLLQYQWSVSPLILLYFVSSLGVHWNRISLAVISQVSDVCTSVCCTLQTFRRAFCPHSWGDWMSSSECWVDAVEGNFPVMRARDGVGKFVILRLLQNVGANITIRRQAQQTTLTWTAATLTTWPLASLYMCCMRVP